MINREKTQRSVASMTGEFYAVLGRVYGDGGSPNELRARLHTEENRALCNELAVGDRTGIAHGLAEIVYLAYGTAFSLGIPLDEAIAAVHDATMMKRGPDGEFKLGDDGTVLKSASYVPPDIDDVLARNSDHRRRVAAHAFDWYPIVGDIVGLAQRPTGEEVHWGWKNPGQQVFTNLYVTVRAKRWPHEDTHFEVDPRVLREIQRMNNGAIFQYTSEGATDEDPLTKLREQLHFAAETVANTMLAEHKS